MSKIKIFEIITNIDSKDYTNVEKGYAIREILELPTHMGITKATMLAIIRWLFNMVFEVEEKA